MPGRSQGVLVYYTTLSHFGHTTTDYNILQYPTTTTVEDEYCLSVVRINSKTFIACTSSTPPGVPYIFRHNVGQDILAETAILGRISQLSSVGKAPRRSPVGQFDQCFSVTCCSVLAGSPHRSQETRKFYQKLNASRNGFVPRAEICRDKDGGLLTDGRGVIERWKQYFDQHLNGVENVGTGAHVNGRNDDASAAEDGNEPTPTLREVKDAIHQLKTNKAADKDGIAAEPIKMGPDKLAICLHRLIVRI
ncbi:uncharacterized protein LOC134285059 [Aedes albopictus]|uniref:EF-hand domain-containing protein n=1 Tax=Aedes albopictus TaxID=7160 RepID=A0ABM1YL59_AEDAL